MIDERWWHEGGALHEQHPVQETNGEAGLVVCWDRDIHKSQRRVGVAESNDWDVHIRRLANWLVVSAWVCQNKQAGLHEFLLDLVSEASSNVLGTSVLGIFEHSTLAIWTS